MEGNGSYIPAQLMSNLDSGWKVGLSCAYSVLLFLSLTGNGLVVHVVRKNPSLRTTTNIFMASLSIANLLTNFTYHPIEVLQIHIGMVWIGGGVGSVLCSMARYCRGGFYFVSITSLVFVSIDRYLCVVTPLRRTFTSRHMRKLVILIWIVSLAMTMPVAFKAEVKQYGKIFVCTVKSQEDEEVLISYIVFGFFFGFMVPLIVMLTLYIAIGYKLWAHNRPGNHDINQRDHLVRKRVSIAMAAIVTVFVVCWLPLQVFILRSLTSKGNVYDEDSSMAQLHRLLVLLCCCSSAVIPWLTIFLSQTMRKLALNIFGCCNSRPCFCLRGSRTTVKPGTVVVLPAKENASSL